MSWGSTDANLRFDIVSWLDVAGNGDPEGATMAEIAIRADGRSFTRLYDSGSRSVRGHLRASAYCCAAWIVANARRMLWEFPNVPGRDGIDYQLSHSLAAAGGGYVWPDLRFETDGRRVRLSTHVGSRTWSPVTFLREERVWIDRSAFIDGVDALVTTVGGRLADLGIRDEGLADDWRAVVREWQTGDAQRRIEAILGFDVDQAPPHLLADIEAWSGTVGGQAADEIVARVHPDQTRDDFDAIRSWLECQAMSSTLHLPAIADVGVETGGPPWREGYALAQAVRDHFSLGLAPVDDGWLRANLGIENRPAAVTPVGGVRFAFGRRTLDRTTAEVALTSPLVTGRRFQAARLICDAISAPAEDRILPVLDHDSRRQKRQRAFAAEFLAPANALRARVSGSVIGRDEFDGLVEAFAVDGQVLAWQMANHGIASVSG